MNTQGSAKVTETRGGACCCTSKSSNSSIAKDPRKNAGNTLQRQLRVKGATCGGCVRNIEQTLHSVAGVTEARMNLASGIAVVVGTAHSKDLIEAVDRAGFPATVIN